MAQAVGWCVALDQDAVGGLEALGEGGSWRRVNDWKVGVGPRGGATDVFAGARHLRGGFGSLIECRNSQAPGY